MQLIRGAIYSHLSFTDDGKTGRILSNYREFEKKASRIGLTAIGSDGGLPVKTYRELVEKISEVAYENNRLVLAYRGQGSDYRVKGTSKRSSLYPTIFRDSWNEYVINSKNRPLYFKKLTELAQKMRPEVFKKIEEDESDVDDRTVKVNRVQRRNYNEQMWAIIQHYELFPTPMIDITQSLQVACSFALSNTSDEHGFIYAFGLPSIAGSVTYSVDDEMCVARLQTVCPPQAIRAHFQEGLLVSKFPSTQRKADSCNLSNRMLAKFKISKHDFWSDGFHSLDVKTLLPENDPFATELKEIQKKVFPDLYQGLDAVKSSEPLISSPPSELPSNETL